MNKILYVFKICLFRQQFELTTEEERAFLNLGAFIAREYVRVWFTAPLSSSAPANDLTFLNRIWEYRHVNAEVSKIACQKFLNHLWYLSEDCIALSLFDSDVSLEEKDKIVTAFKRPSKSARDGCARVLSLKLDSLPTLHLSDFVTEESLNMFTRLKMPTDFLALPSASWHDSISFNIARNIARNIMVVNDPAERGVCLMKTYNHILTKDEETKMHLIKVVDKHRRTFKSCNKEVLLRENV